MTFGNLGESFELVAIKSSGISLMRFMRPVLFVSVLLSIIAFLIANYVMPVANLRFATMLYDIRVAKPAFDIKEGIFYDKIPGYAIKVGKKESDGNSISNIIIFESQFSLQDNIITAEKGKMHMSDDKKFLEFDLENGWRYQEKGPYNTAATDYYRLGFKQYKKVFDLSSFNMMKTPDSLFKGSYDMLNVKQLNHAADSIRKILYNIEKNRMQNEVNIHFASAALFLTGGQATPLLKKIPPKSDTYGKTIPDSSKTMAYSKAADKINLIKNALDLLAFDEKQRSYDNRLYQIAWHKKFALSFACMVLFLIGAPLGSIIRKGGLGMPLVVAVIFFLIFHLLNMFGEKFVRQEILPPFWGIWLSCMTLLPIGLFLVFKAMSDSQLFNNEFYFRLFKKIKSSTINKHTLHQIN